MLKALGVGGKRVRRCLVNDPIVSTGGPIRGLGRMEKESGRLCGHHLFLSSQRPVQGRTIDPQRCCDFAD